MKLLDNFQTITIDTLNGFICDGRTEDLHLEFKTVKSSSLKSEDDKRNLARALSGFSNSEGGLLIWGVDARKNSDGIDCAKQLMEITELKQFISRLHELTGEAVSPLVNGVQHKSIEAGNDTGYAVTLVPESDTGPHMAKFGDDRYYKRSGDAFYRMEHFDLADMFGRRKRPLLRLTAKCEYDKRNPKQVSILLGIRNDGRGSAIAPYLAFKNPHGFEIAEFGVDGNGHEGMQRRRAVAPGMNLYAEGTTFVIHPGVNLLVTKIRTPRSAVEGVTGPVKIDFSICAEGYPLRTEVLHIPFGASECEV